MIVLPPQSVVAWRGALSGGHGLAFLTTVFRVVYHLRNDRLWWDDYIVVGAQVADVYYCVVMWLDGFAIHWGDRRSPPSLNLWTSSIPCYTVLWVSRIALALSFSRIFPYGHPARRMSYILAAVFPIIYIPMLLSTMFFCKNGRAGARVRLDLCADAFQRLGYFTCVSDFLADIALISLPLFTLWHIKLRPTERRLVLVLFSGSILTLVSIAIIVFFQYGPFERNLPFIIVSPLLGHIAAAISVIVANLLVVGSFLYRKFRISGSNDSDIDIDLETRPRRHRGLQPGSPARLGHPDHPNDNNNNNLNDATSNSGVTLTTITTDRTTTTNRTGPTTGTNRVTFVSDLTMITEDYSADGPTSNLGQSQLPSQNSSNGSPRHVNVETTRSASQRSISISEPRSLLSTFGTANRSWPAGS